MAVVAAILFSMKVHSQAVYYIDPNSVPLATRSMKSTEYFWHMLIFW